MSAVSSLHQALIGFDDDAQLNDKKIEQLRKEIYTKEIDVAIRVQKDTTTNFQLKPINVTFLNSAYLNDNPLFKEIKAVFDDYNRIVLVGTTEEREDVRLKPTLIDCMLKFMRLVMLTSDRQAQLNILKVVYDWYRDTITKRDYKSKTQRQFEESLERRLQQMRRENIQPTPVLPSQISQAQRAAFLNKFRTMHPELHPPDYRLKNLKRRILNFDEAQLTNKYVQKSPLSRVKFIKPPPVIFHKEIPEVAVQTAQLEVKEAQQNNFTSVQTNNNLSTEGTEGAQQVSLVDGAVPPDQQGSVEPQQDDLMNFGEEEELGQFEPQPEPEEQAGKLDPNIKNYVFPQSEYREDPERRLAQRILKRTYNQERKIRQDQAQYESMKSWSRSRCRMQSQLNRKIQATRQMAKLSMPTRIIRAKTQKSQTNISFDFSQEKPVQSVRFEDTINDQKFQAVKKFGLKQINYQKGDPVNHVPSLSTFDRRISERQANRSLSDILNEHSKDKQRQDSLEQMQKIKQRFAKYKLPIDMQKIGQGLMQVQDLPAQRLGFMGPLQVKLPSNPFIKVAKKKKKKGKKK